MPQNRAAAGFSIIQRMPAFWCGYGEYFIGSPPSGARMPFAHMLCLAPEYFQIFRAIVLFVSVYVVDHFAGFK